MKIWIIGDVHGDSQYSLYQFLKHKTINIAIQLGDFGFVWHNGDVKGNKFLRKFEQRYPHKTLITILGNHDNYDAIEKLPIVDLYGAKAYQIKNNVFAVKRGEVLSIGRANILCVGGADSTDKQWRLEEQAKDKKHRAIWWAQERITQSDIENALHNIQGKHIHYVCTHEAPLEIVCKLFDYSLTGGVDPLSSTFMLQKLYSQISYRKTWFCGHYHMSETFVSDWRASKTFEVLGIDEIKEIEV